jgi:hypothetical protein
MMRILELRLLANDFSTTRTVTIGEFLTEAQIEKCIELQKAPAICEQVIKPNLEEIDRKLGQKNDPMYLAFSVEYLINRSRL